MDSDKTINIEPGYYFLRGMPGEFTEIRRAADVREEASQELRDQKDGGTTIGGVRCATRIIEARRWWDYYTRSVAHSACCNAKARDVVGGGFSLNGDNLSDALRDEISDVIDRSQESIIDACRDWEVTGFMGLECVPMRGGGLYCLNHIDSHTIWPALNLPLFMHRRGNLVTRFTELGEKEAGHHQMLWLNNLHWPYNTYYGVPDVVSVVIQIETVWEALKHNREFFARRGGYRWMMLVKSPHGAAGSMPGPGGPEMTSPANLIKAVNFQFSKAGKDSDSDLISIPVGPYDVQLQKLDADAKDMDFAGLLGMFRNDILMAHGVPPLKAGIVETGTLGGNVGQEQLRAYRDNVVDPKQRRWNRLMSELIRVWWGVDVEFTFTPVEIDEFAMLAPHAVSVFKAGILTRAEARDMLGKEDKDDGDDVWIYDLSLPGEFGPDDRGDRPGATQ